ncbi:MAG TPA: UDP-2,3-diacylglucosamine diphosphatase LpxI [Beijerinckiaceae bacterium]|nr:UDP-2,3-diacylglucosamine diphosphatase LpxI [Beijerinckiaceae bacterium]
MPPEAGPIVIFAGSGRFPELLADTLQRSGRACRILAFRGFTDSSLRQRADAITDLLDVQRMIACLREWRPSAVTLAGGMQRPKPSAVLSAFSILRNRRELAEIMSRGDDQLLRGAVALIEEQGCPVVGVRDLAPELLASGGCQGVHMPDAEDLRAVRLGMRLLTDISAYDIGQATVAAGERILAIEGPEGTDRMLGRVRRLRRSWSLKRPPRAGVLVKMPKRGQDLRIDLPAVGPRTVARAAAAGLRGVAVASGVTLVLDREETVRIADRLGLFLVGVDGVDDAALRSEAA